MTHEERLARLERILQQVQDQLSEHPVMGRQVYNALVGDQRPDEIKPIEQPARDWEVLEFVCVKDGGAKIGTIARPSDQEWQDAYINVGMCVNSGHWAIHRVRRLSDRVEFSVGDIVKHDADGVMTIKDFSIGPRGERIYINGGKYLVQYCEKPLFTTADGIDHYDENDFIWLLFTSDGRIEQKAYRQIDPVEWGAGRPELYDTKEAAEAAYKKWLRSQRVLSLDDLNIGADLDELVKQRVK